MTDKIKLKKEIKITVQPLTETFVNSVCGTLKSQKGLATKALLREHRKELAK